MGIVIMDNVIFGADLSILFVSVATVISLCNLYQGVVLVVRNIGGTRVLVPGHQNSGAPPFFFRVFLMVFSHLCWQCSNKNRKCREHINTLGKKDKMIFLMPIFEIKTKNLLST